MKVLTDEQRRRIEERLLEERQEAMGALRDLGDDMARDEPAGGELSRIPTHLADLATDEQEGDMDARLAERQAERIHAIDEALERLRERPDEFGRSIISGKPIPFERLELLPWTRVLADEERPETGELRRSREVDIEREDDTDVRGPGG